MSSKEKHGQSLALEEGMQFWLVCDHCVEARRKDSRVTVALSNTPDSMKGIGGIVIEKATFRKMMHEACLEIVRERIKVLNIEERLAVEADRRMDKAIAVTLDQVERELAGMARIHLDRRLAEAVATMPIAVTVKGTSDAE